MPRVEICIAGYGGQGLILAGRILAEAATAAEDKFVLQSQDYGPQARGGSSKTVVVVADEEIDYPEMTIPDILVALSQSAVEQLSDRLRPKSTLIGDVQAVETWPTFDGRTLKLPLMATAKEATGKEIATGIVALGVIANISDVIQRETLRELIAKRVPPDTKEANIAAFEAGCALVLDERESRSDVA